MWSSHEDLLKPELMMLTIESRSSAAGATEIRSQLGDVIFCLARRCLISESWVCIISSAGNVPKWIH